MRRDTSKRLRENINGAAALEMQRKIVVDIPNESDHSGHAMNRIRIRIRRIRINVF